MYVNNLHSQASNYWISSILSGRTKLSTNATKKTTATQFSAKTFFTSAGKILKIAGTWVKPIPILIAKEAMMTLRWV